MEFKAGWKTTEFWFTLLAQVVNLAVLFGLPQAGVDTVAEAVSSAIPAVFTIIMAAVSIWKYIEAREQVKMAAALSGSVIEPA